MEKENKATLSEKFAEYKAEYNRIQWMSREDLFKKTIVVIGNCLVFLAIIFAYDFAFTEVMLWISRIVA